VRDELNEGDQILVKVLALALGDPE